MRTAGAVAGVALLGVLLAPIPAYAEHAGPPGPPVPTSHADPICALHPNDSYCVASTHHVRQGEWLWKIARARLKLAAKPASSANVRKVADMIYADNRRVIGPNKNRLRPGQRLSIRATQNWPV